MILNRMLYFVFISVITTVTVETVVTNNSTKENDEKLQPTHEKIHTEDPAISSKFQTGNARFLLIN